VFRNRECCLQGVNHASTSRQSMPGELASIVANRFGQLTPWQRQNLPPQPVMGSFIDGGSVYSGGSGRPLRLSWLPAVDDAARYHGRDSPVQAAPLSGRPGLPGTIPGHYRPPYTGRPLLRLRLRLDLAQGGTRQDGPIMFVRKHGYIAREVLGPLRSRYGSRAVSLPPGIYHCYFLPHSRRILAEHASLQTASVTDTPPSRGYPGQAERLARFWLVTHRGRLSGAWPRRERKHGDV
jgi:hypothetical protein